MPELISWLGNASYGVAGQRFRDDNPFLFQPSDISGLQMWLDANDASTVFANPFGTVDKWHNKGDLSGNFDLSGSADIRYGFNSVNGLEVVTFTGLSYMTGSFAMNFHDRSVFIVSRRNQPIDPSGNFFSWLTSEVSNGMESGIIQAGADYTYILSRHPGFSPEVGFTTTTDTTGVAELVTFQNSSTDLSGNYTSFYSQSQTLVVSALAGYNQSNILYQLGNYGNGVPLPNDYDMCEFLIYDSVLTSDQRTQVEAYLTVKWGLVEPPPPPPLPFAPTDIAGLQVWMDGANESSLSLSNTDVLSWSNVGSAGGLFSVASGTPLYVSSRVAMPTGAQLDAYFALPYTSRTLFGVLEVVDDLSTVGYPFVNFMDAQASDGRQAGLSYDSNVPTFNFTVCQAGTNCPIVAPFATMPSGLLLVTGVIDESNSSTTEAFLNNGSNINTSTDLGNLFNQNPIPYVIGTSNASGPAFRLAEFLEYDTLLSSSNISTVTSYLNTKWSLGF